MGSLPENICYLKSHFNVSIVWERQHLLRMTSLADRKDVLLRKAVLTVVSTPSPSEETENGAQPYLRTCNNHETVFIVLYQTSEYGAS